MNHVAFDLGNVLVEVDMAPFYGAVEELGINRYDMDRVMKLYNRTALCGNVDMLDVFVDELEDEAEAKYLMDAWCSGCKPNDQMFNFVHSLRHEGFKIAYVSNVDVNHLKNLRNNYPEFMGFAHVSHMSCEVGAAKPCKLFYQSFLMQNEDFSGCTYLDDNEENIKMGSSCKFDSICFNLNNLKQQKMSVMKQEIVRIKDRLLRGC